MRRKHHEVRGTSTFGRSGPDGRAKYGFTPKLVFAMIEQ